jgi:hypothetical protein
MTRPSSEDLFRQAAEAEAGMPVSAGARVAHVRLALESGRAITVDLSIVPDQKRPALVRVIREIVKLAAANPCKEEFDLAPAATKSVG